MLCDTQASPSPLNAKHQNCYTMTELLQVILGNGALLMIRENQYMRLNDFKPNLLNVEDDSNKITHMEQIPQNQTKLKFVTRFDSVPISGDGHRLRQQLL